MLRDTLIALDDAAAVDVLTAFAKQAARPGRALPEWDSGKARAISEALGVSAATDPDGYDYTVGRGAIAKKALLVLADDDLHAPAIKLLAASTRNGAGYDVESMTLITALLMVLETQLDFVRDEGGRWTATVHEDAADPAVLKDFGSNFLAYMDQ